MSGSKKDGISVLSMNCRGLANPQKRRDVFQFLRQKSFSIYMLQDTHFDPKLEDCIRAEWGYKAYFASFNTASRGVAILFNNNFEFEIKKIYKDIDGNFIIVYIKTVDTDLLIVNLYGPNDDDLEFYVQLEELITDLDVDNVIIGGDWNLVIDFSLDYDNYKHYNNPKAQEQVHKMIQNLDLNDIWRDINPERRRYTWRRSNPVQQSRLDFFLISDFLSTSIVDADIKAGYRTDHSMITLNFSFAPPQKRSNFWKFNVSLLKDNIYVEEINETIKTVLDEYSATPYDRENILQIPKDCIQLIISDQLFLDVLLMKIRQNTITYASKKKRENTEKEFFLEKRINILEQNSPLTEEQTKELLDCKEEFEKLREKKMQGVLLRSRARWVADGEKVTQYFCALEKRNYVNKSMFKMVKEDGKEINDLEQIRNEVKNFYKKLYEERSVEDCNIYDLVKELKTLSVEESEKLEGEIKLDEASFALKNMKHNKSPGTDGFSAEFFKFFWRNLGPFVLRSLNEGFRKGELSITQREGLIICVPKGDKAKEFIKNWRPISLLNVVYKIGSACIANRMKQVLSLLINEDQTGFIKGRFLGDNIRLIYDIISYVNDNKRSGLLLCLDFEKAFDSLDWGFMNKVLVAFGFGPDICKWIFTFYKDIKSSVLVNGQASDWFTVKRGCRQGDPISPYIFILCVEIMAVMIRENKQIKGITIYDTEHKISQYADDTEIMLDGDRNSFEVTMHTVDVFSKCSGLFLNTTKTAAVWLGNRRNSHIKYMQHLNMEWDPHKFKILGIWFTNDLKDCTENNVKEKFAEIKILYKIWLKRQITPLGRIAILKSLILSKLTHLWMLLPNPPDNINNTIQKSIFEFVWKRKNDRISRKTTVKNIINGGIGIPDINIYMQALKICWLKKCIVGNHKWKSILLGNNFLLANLEKLGPNLPTDKLNLNCFWSDVFRAYRNMAKNSIPTNESELLAECIYYNLNITIAKKTIFNRNLFNKGVFCIGHFIKENGCYLTYAEFKGTYDVGLDFLTYTGYVQVIKKYVCNFSFEVQSNSFSETNKIWKTIHSVHRGARTFYDVLSVTSRQPNCCEKWELKFEKQLPWNKIFKKINMIKDIKLKWFQIRIVHRIIATNITLFSMHIAPDDKCTFCGHERESIEHVFWNCVKVQQFWQQLQVVLNAKCPNAIRVTFNKFIVLFGHDDGFISDPVFDYIVVLAKFFIYKCRLGGCVPQLCAFFKYLKFCYEVERYVAYLHMRSNKFNVEWISYQIWQ